MRTRATIGGARELATALAKLPERVQRRALLPALNKGADVIRAAARRNLRQLGLVLSGRLVRNVRRRRARGEIDEVVVQVGPSKGGFYGKFAEFGTSKQRATPWLRPAVHEDGPKAVKAIGQALGPAIAKEVHRLRTRRRG